MKSNIIISGTLYKSGLLVLLTNLLTSDLFQSSLSLACNNYFILEHGAVKHSHPKRHHGHARSVGVFSGFGDEATYEFNVSGLRVKVYKYSLTKIRGMDAITNSTITTLEHGCGVALQISQAAGSDMV